MDNLSVTNHAVKRFIERGRLVLRDHEKKSPRDAIRRLVAKGYENIKLSECPFYSNQVGAKQIHCDNFKFYIRNNTVTTCVYMRDEFSKNWRY